MSLPDIEHHRVEKLLNAFCAQRVPPHARNQIKMSHKIIGNKVILIESRPYFKDPLIWTEMFIAQLEYSAATKEWSLYAYDRNDKRKHYSSGPLESLIQEVDKDNSGVFWG